MSCNRVYSDDVAVVECSGVKLDVPEGAATAVDCFHHEDSKEEFHMLKRRNTVINGPKAVDAPLEARSPNPAIANLRNRQYQCTATLTGRELVGDGNPHQNYYLKQLSVSTCPLMQSSEHEYETNCRLIANHHLRLCRLLRGRVGVHILHHRLHRPRRHQPRLLHRRLLRLRDLEHRQGLHVQRRAKHGRVHLVQYRTHSL